MTDNELLLSISRMMDTKLRAELQPIKDELRDIKEKIKGIEVRLQQLENRVQRLEIEVQQLNTEVQRLSTEIQQLNTEVQQLKTNQENVIMPRLNTIESCYTGTYNRYRSYVEKMEAAFMDIDVLKMVVADHSEKLLKLA